MRINHNAPITKNGNKELHKFHNLVINPQKDEPKHTLDKANKSSSSSSTSALAAAAGNVARVTLGVATEGPSLLLWFDAELFGEMTDPLFPQLLRCAVSVDDVAGGDGDDIVVVRDVSRQS